VRDLAPLVGLKHLSEVLVESFDRMQELEQSYDRMQERGRTLGRSKKHIVKHSDYWKFYEIFPY